MRRCWLSASADQRGDYFVQRGSPHVGRVEGRLVLLFEHADPAGEQACFVSAVRAPGVRCEESEAIELDLISQAPSDGIITACSEMW